VRLARRRAGVHQPAHGREPSRRRHEEHGLALSFGADSLGARRRPRHRVAISPLTEKRGAACREAPLRRSGPIRSRARPGQRAAAPFRWRRPDRLAGIPVFEVDHPATSGEKRHRLIAAGLDPSRIVQVTLDFDREPVAETLAGHGFDMRCRTAVSAAGTKRSIERHSRSRSSRCRALSNRTPETRDARPPWTICVVDAQEPPPSRADQNHVGGSIATRPHQPLVPDPEPIEPPVLSPPRRLQARCRAGRRPLNARSPPANLMGQGLEISDLGAADLVLT
jgi:hypothetical protein